MTEQKPTPEADFGADGLGGRARDWRDDARDALADPPDFEAALNALPDPDPLADLLADAREALKANPPKIEDAREALAKACEAQPLEPAQPVEHWRGEPTPEPVLRPQVAPDGALLSVGEVALLASAGGLGKSTVTLGLSAAAARDGGGDAFGLRVAPGPVVLASYEDAPARIAARLCWYAPWPTGKPAPQAWRNLYLLPRPRPLWRADDYDYGGSCPGPDWPRFWKTVRETGAKLAIVDPASVALADVDTTQTGPVRAFLDAMAAEAAKAECGVLIVAHDTKAARNEARAGGDPGAGAVAGSAAWYDAARGVLYLRSEHGGLTLECLKANYGRTGWGARLRIRDDDGYHGPDPKAEPTFRDADELRQWRDERKAEAKAKAKAKNGSDPADDGGEAWRNEIQ